MWTRFTARSRVKSTIRSSLADFILSSVLALPAVGEIGPKAEAEMTGRMSLLQILRQSDMLDDGRDKTPLDVMLCYVTLKKTFRGRMAYLGCKSVKKDGKTS